MVNRHELLYFDPGEPFLKTKGEDRRLRDVGGLGVEKQAKSVTGIPPAWFCICLKKLSDQGMHHAS